MQVVPSWQDRDVTFPYTGHNVLQNEELSTELLHTRSFFREENNAESAFYLKNTKKCYFYSNDKLSCSKTNTQIAPKKVYIHILPSNDHFMKLQFCNVAKKSMHTLGSFPAQYI